ncbi:MAG: hypothetical protein J6F30_18150 [Cellulosilyticum sp.]|nr:hypothetical protein [Cellulosilyticum sp.]
MNNQNEWKEFFKSRKGVLLLCVMAIIAGTLYAVYLKKNGSIDVGYVQEYLVDSKGQKEMVLEEGIITYIFYFKKYAIIWLLGLISFSLPLVIILAGVNIFEYGFVLTSIYLTFGRSGFIIASRLFIFQGILLMIMLLELVCFVIKRNHVFIAGNMKSYITYLISGAIGCGVIAFFEIFLI